MQSIIPFEILAYFDPGSGSLLVQALVGGAAGVFVFAKYIWEVALKLMHGRNSRDKTPADKMLARSGSSTSRR